MTDAVHIFDTGSPPGLPVGIHYFGIGRGGALLSEMPETGEHGPGYMRPSVDPDDTTARFYGVLGTIPGDLALETDEYGRVTGSSTTDGQYTVPFDLYREHQLVGSTYFRFNFGAVGANVNLTAGALIQANSISGAVVTVTTGSKSVNLTAAPLLQVNAISAAVMTVTPPGAPGIDISKVSPFRIVPFEGSGSRIVVF